MGLLKEFKEFAMRGNVIDLAVGVVIGGAFGKIVAALVEKVIMPGISLIGGGVNFADLAYRKAITNPDGSAGEIVLGYGAFIQSIVDFLIIAFCIFWVVKALNTFKKKEEAAPPAPPEPTKEELLLTEIRDLLKK